MLSCLKAGETKPMEDLTIPLVPQAFLAASSFALAFGARQIVASQNGVPPFEMTLTGPRTGKPLQASHLWAMSKTLKKLMLVHSL